MAAIVTTHHRASAGVAPICMIDLTRMRICNTSTAWAEVDLIMPGDRALVAAVHPEDRAALHDFLHTAVATRTGQAAYTVIRMKTSTGWRPTGIAAVNVIGLLAPHEVMIRLS